MAGVPLTIDHTVIELLSPSGILNEIQFELDEYVANGAKLGFLIYPPERNICVYRPGHIPQCLDNPQSVPADSELPGFTLDLTKSGNNATYCLLK